MHAYLQRQTIDKKICLDFYRAPQSVIVYIISRKDFIVDPQHFIRDIDNI